MNWKKDTRAGSVKMAIVVRKDLGLSCGKMAAQVAHAAVKCAMSTKRKKKEIYSSWDREGAKKVVLRARDRVHLQELRALAEGLGLTATIITDAGHTEIPPNTITCLGIGPGPSELIDKVTGELPLY